MSPRRRSPRSPPRCWSPTWRSAVGRVGASRRREGEAEAHGRMLVQIRERTFLEVLDLALVVIRHRPAPIGLAAVVGIAPFAALNALLTSDPEFPLSLFTLLVLLEVPWATAPLTAVLGGLMFDQRPTVDSLLRGLLRALPAL